MWNRRRRAAISQSEIRKRCKLYGAVCRGYKAFNQTADYDVVEIPYRENSPEWKAWMQGWNLAQDKEQEKDNE
ncbi:hypothetical protein KAR91_54200 [Candidatus Pacearchaeota archaeon]|nr:hypothetical protein [Candidatus Pacearchaeota archaeon]